MTPDDASESRDTRDADDPFYAAIVQLCPGRKVSKEDAYALAELSKAQYHKRVKEGTLCEADRVIKAAEHLGVNWVELLIMCKPDISPSAILEYAAKMMVDQYKEIAGMMPRLQDGSRNDDHTTTGEPPPPHERGEHDYATDGESAGNAEAPTPDPRRSKAAIGDRIAGAADARKRRKD